MEMKREILFKAKRIENGEWVEGDLYQEKDFHGKVISVMIVEHRKDLCLVSGAPENNQWWREVDPKTVCQYTGIKDKNGVKIFEGDKLYMEDLPSHEYDVMIWNNEWQFHTKTNLDHSQHDIDCAECTAIGNIHDND